MDEVALAQARGASHFLSNLRKIFFRYQVKEPSKHGRESVDDKNIDVKKESADDFNFYEV